VLEDGRTLWEADAGLLQRHGLAPAPPLEAAATPTPQQEEQPDDDESESDEEPVRPARELAASTDNAGLLYRAYERLCAAMCKAHCISSTGRRPASARLLLKQA
jgi:hypothetical protein